MRYGEAVACRDDEHIHFPYETVVFGLLLVLLLVRHDVLLEASISLANHPLGRRKFARLLLDTHCGRFAISLSNL